MSARRSLTKNAAIVDEQLKKYRSMRDFSVTPEPAGGTPQKQPKVILVAGAKIKGKGTSARLPFVIQKHAASRLHYDFRLGWNGVLKSWAIPKGPSYVTKDKRLAAQVEDHPIEYGGFEGIIPEGSYGGGTVMLWDMGTWEPQAGHTDVDAGLRDGSLKFTMHGKKMKGNWALVRMGAKAANEAKPNWLLIKEHDPFERSDDDPAITDEEPNSVATNRTMDEIARDRDHIWQSNRDDKNNSKLVPQHRKTATNASVMARLSASRLNEFPKEKLPAFIPPQLAFEADHPVDQSGWVHELKLDGYRIQARKNDGKVELLTRTGLDWTYRMKAIAAEVAMLPAQNALIDGEVVVLAADGTTSFAHLQAAFKEGEKHTLTYFVFDLLHLNGHNLRDAELTTRKDLLRELLEADPEAHPDIRFSEHIENEGNEVFQRACDLHAEGIISKRSSAKYTSGRSRVWFKIKCAHDQEVVIGGFTLPSNGSHGVGALLLGYYDENGRLIYAGRTGTGFTRKTHQLLRDQLEKLRVNTSPFDELSREAMRGARWVKPELVAQVSFATWTNDNIVRQAAFKGLREDRPAKEVHRGEPIVAGQDSRKAKASHNVRDGKAAKTTSASRSARGAAKPASQSDSEHATVRLTHPDKVLDPESGLTKQQLADYYWAIAEHMLPHIANRPLSLVRCPEGSTGPCFFQKHTNHMLPPGIETVEVPDKKTGKLEPYITLSTRESLAGLAQMGVLEVHPWGSQNNDLEHPDRIVIDLDPDETIPWKTLAESAEEVRRLFKRIGLESFLKSTGGKGLHVVVPIAPEHEWPAIKQLAHAIALQLERENPSLYLTKMSKAARKGRIFVDYLRNERGATAVAAFSPRARTGAPVSMPLKWAELREEQRPLFHVSDFNTWRTRLRRDPWESLPALKQRIDPDKLGEM